MMRYEWATIDCDGDMTTWQSRRAAELYAENRAKRAGDPHVQIKWRAVSRWQDGEPVEYAPKKREVSR